MAKKKEKTVYVDDGRTLADMSGVGGGIRGGKSNVRARDAWNTYWNAVKMMFLPMLAVIGVLVILYAVMYFIFAAA